MEKKTLLTPASAYKNAGWIALVCVIALGASACGAAPANALTPTPTTLMGNLPLNGQSTGIPTAIPASGTAQPIDVCSLVTQTEAEAVLGQAVTQISPGVDTNTLIGGTGYFCMYRGTDLTVNVEVVDMGSAAAAGQAMQATVAKMMADSTTTTTPQQGGPGEQAYWATSLHAGNFTVLKANYIISVLIGGNVGDPATFKAGLLTLTESVVAKF